MDIGCRVVRWMELTLDRVQWQALVLAGLSSWGSTIRELTVQRVNYSVT
jgi:hypothetical protein